MSLRRVTTIEIDRPGIDGDITAAEAAQLRYDANRASAEAGVLSGAVDALEAANAVLTDQFAALSGAVAAVPDGSVPMPALSGLFFHLDATAIGAASGTRLSAWTDRVTGSVQAVQATVANQPLFLHNQLNGRPAVVFDSARNDNLVASGLAPGVVSGTVFVVALPQKAPAVNRYLFGAAPIAKNLYHSTQENIGAQATETFGAPGMTGAPLIIAAAFGSSGSTSLRVNGVRTAGVTGVPTAQSTSFSIGHRTSLAAGSGFSGPIGEVVYYNRALTDDECASVERYLAAKWGIPVSSQTLWYVDTLGGNDANTGRTAGSALATLAQAWQGIAARKEPNATILINAPETQPVRLPTGSGLLKSDGGTVRLLPMHAGATWHARGTVEVKGGWTHMGSGVYRRPLTLSLTTAPNVYIPTMLDTDGNPTRIFTRNTTTPTTPAAGEFGYDSGFHYLHLPGNADPNTHTIELVVVQWMFRTHTGSTIVFDRAHLRGAQNSVVLSGSGVAGEEGGYVLATDSVAEFALTGGWVTAGNTDGMRCVRCTGQFSDNDGFNHHATVGRAARMELVDFEAAWNNDEGVSPHDDTILVAHGGRAHHNGHGGITSVGRAISYLYGTEVDHNRRRDSTVTGWDAGGVAILEQSKLISLDLYSHDNPGPGVEIETAAGATWTDNGGTRSGTAHGNGAADAV